MEGFFIRAVLMKNNYVIFNYTYTIIGTENVQIATIVSADQVCNHYLQLAMKSDTFQVSLGDGHLGVNVSIIRNAQLANFIKTLNKVKIKTGLYTIVSGHKFDWLQYARIEGGCNHWVALRGHCGVISRVWAGHATGGVDCWQQNTAHKLIGPLFHLQILRQCTHQGCRGLDRHIKILCTVVAGSSDPWTASTNRLLLLT